MRQQYLDLKGNVHRKLLNRLNLEALAQSDRSRAESEIRTLLMELLNELSPRPDDQAARFAAETAVSLIQPYAPHIAEELWGVLGHERLWEEPWPSYDPALLEREMFELVIQVNGRVRDRVEASTDESEDELIARAKASERVQAQLDGREIRQAIVVPGKLVNLVV